MNNEEKILNKLSELGGLPDKVGTIEQDVSVLKEDVHSLKEGQVEIMEILAHMSGILSRLDQERVFTIEWVRRLEKEVSRNSQDILVMKQKLNIA